MEESSNLHSRQLYPPLDLDYSSSTTRLKASLDRSNEGNEARLPTWTTPPNDELSDRIRRVATPTSCRRFFVPSILTFCILLAFLHYRSTESLVWDRYPFNDQSDRFKNDLNFESKLGKSPSSRFAPDQPGTITFSSSLYPPLPPIDATSALRHPITTLAFSQLPSPRSVDCLDSFVSNGDICEDLIDRFDSAGQHAVKTSIVWTWTNGTNRRVAEWRQSAMTKLEEGVIDGVTSVTARRKRTARREEGGERLNKRDEMATARHFRDHDELRYSLRSVVASLPSSIISSITLLVGDTSDRFPSSSSDSRLAVSTRKGVRYAEVPTWLDLQNDKVVLASISPSSSTPSLVVQPHSSLFQHFAVVDEGGIRDRRTETLPTFSSSAIESQMYNVDYSTPEIFYFNDDCFVAQNLSISDLTSPLSGPVFRMFRGFTVEGAEPGTAKDDKEGEWPALRTSNWLLDRRFGKRSRPYLCHVAKMLSIPMLQEAYLVWPEEHDETASTRFRGQGKLNIASRFLSIQYQIEKHREALLWSFLVARSDSNHDGVHSVEERIAMLDVLMADSAFDDDALVLYALMPHRRTLLKLSTARQRTGLPEPLASNIEFSSFDGYAHFASEETESIPKWPGWPSFNDATTEGTGAPCTISFETCFSSDFLDLQPDALPKDSIETFRRVAFEYKECGDCLIAHLLAKSGETGLSAFLPIDDGVGGDVEADDGMEPEAIGVVGKRWEEVEYSPWTGSSESIRRRAISLIHRYSYTLASSSFAFRSVQTGGDELSTSLEGLSSPADRPAFWALNDDISSQDDAVIDDVNERMHRWFEGVWSDPTEWEKSTD